MVNSASGGHRSPKPKGGPAAPPGSKAPPSKTASDEKILVQVVDDKTKKPISQAKVDIFDEANKLVAQGESDWQGHVEKTVPKPGSYKVVVTKIPEESGGGAASGGGESEDDESDADD